MSQTCPSCRAKLQIPEAMNGKKVRCPKCKAPFIAGVVPDDEWPGSEQDSNAFASFSDPTPPRKTALEPPKKPRSRRPIEDDDDDDSPRDKSHRDKPKKKSPKTEAKPFPWMLASCIGGGVAVVAIIVVVFFAFTGGGAKTAKAKTPKAEAEAPVAAAVKNPFADVPMPPSMAPDTTQRVKKATVHLTVESANGDKGQGSGFLYFDRGLVVTNAHVVGMLHSKEPPLRVDVTINSNQNDEIKREAIVLGVDQDEDLAVLRIDGDAKSLPPPLLLDFTSPLTELQVLYVFGFPLGTQLGKDITVAPAPISSLRKAKDGTLGQIQVNSSMQPGNSGGPVVDARGNVVGVAVSIIKGTQINFAVPAERVHGLVEGRVVSTNFGEPYRDNSGVRMPLKMTCIDPMSRIKGMRLDVWTGPDGLSRPGGKTQPAPVAGDTKKNTVSVKYLNKEGVADIAVPSVGLGQALWVQPVFTLAAGQLAWGPAFTAPMSREVPLQRESAKLEYKFESGQRTLELTSKISVRKGGKDKAEIAENIEAKILETVQPRQGNVVIKLDVGPANANITADKGDGVGKFVGANEKGVALFQNMKHAYVLNADGRLVDAGNQELSSEYEQGARSLANELAMLLRNTFEAVAITLPSKRLQPMETWHVKVPIRVGSGRYRRDSEVDYICTFEGIRVAGLTGSREAFIRLDGDLPPRNFGGDLIKAKVEGYALLDLERGYFSKVHVVIREDIDLPELYLVESIESTMTRAPGNPHGITAAPGVKMGTPRKSIAVPVAGKKVFEQNGVLLVGDPNLPGKDTQYQAFKVKLEKGRAYVVDLVHAPSDLRYDPFLVLKDPAGRNIADDDDSGGDLNSRIMFIAPQTGEYVIVASCFTRLEADAPYRLQVLEVDAKK